MTGLYHGLKQYDYQFVFCFPNPLKTIRGSFDNNVYYGFKTERKDYKKYSKSIELFFHDILISENPDVVHMFGTEYPYALALAKACERTKKTNALLVNIQGLVSVYEKHYFAGIPDRVAKGFTIKELIRGNSVWLQKRDFKKRGMYETRILKTSKYVIGRTEWDKACVNQINRNITYLTCNEIMRDSFYTHRWVYKNCKKRTIFISQGNYPIKGLHYAVEALGIVKKYFPDALLVVAGENIYEKTKRIRTRTNYGRYIKSLILKTGLKDSIHFIGSIPERKMVCEYLSANVFVSASSIENSSNSVSEALLLGVPVVSADVGGISSLIDHDRTGYLYPFDEPYMLATIYVKYLRRRNP